MYSNEILEIVGKSLVSDMYYIRDAFINLCNWVVNTWTIKKWNPVWDTKRYDDAYCEINLLDTTHEKTD
jgi:hypothetical protein